MNDSAFPRVTGVMRALNLIDDRWFSEEGRARGTAVHLALRFYAENDLAWDSVDPVIRPFVEAGVRFLEDAKAPRNADVEIEVVHEGYGYVGHPDWLGELFGQDSVLDYKSGGLDKNLAGIQTAAYELALVKNPHRRRLALQLFPNGRYKLVDLTPQIHDRARWLACLDLFRTFIAPRNGHRGAA